MNHSDQIATVSAVSLGATSLKKSYPNTRLLPTVSVAYTATATSVVTMPIITNEPREVVVIARQPARKAPTVVTGVTGPGRTSVVTSATRPVRTSTPMIPHAARRRNTAWGVGVDPCDDNNRRPSGRGPLPHRDRLA